jgi:hypothetical protein
VMVCEENSFAYIVGNWPDADLKLFSAGPDDVLLTPLTNCGLPKRLPHDN